MKNKYIVKPISIEVYLYSSIHISVYSPLFRQMQVEKKINFNLSVSLNTNCNWTYLLFKWILRFSRCSRKYSWSKFHFNFTNLSSRSTFSWFFKDIFTWKIKREIIIASMFPTLCLPITDVLSEWLLLTANSAIFSYIMARSS